MNKHGKIIISLDFELLWGIFDVVDYNSKKKYFWQTREIIPEILKLFEEYQVHATWATVGMLFNKNWKEWEENIPSEIPNYRKKTLSAYKFGTSIKSKSTEEFCFAPELIKLISRTKGQELATHTYSHYYCLEEGQTDTSFDKDLAKAVSVAKSMDIDLKSLVFPRNQLTKEYLQICAKHGIENVRSNPSSWYWKDATSNSLVNKLARTGDAYVNLGKKTYPASFFSKNVNLPLEQKASRFLRPVEGNRLMRSSKINRIKNEIEAAAKKNEIYHLWWHPHNFGDHPEESIKDLKEILVHYKAMQDKYAFQSLNMQELGALYS
ncbi:polysaccharide deacetylase family protein [Autumnicola edwardsiae]|uniref:Polysaccharide deacetylase family protein n=1 Tax=Autumnicola edwardsiae TaxID=3075594 RepID=A0ABU3CTE0_9FLAO|nr:polysaccharide deacetylase family protein [Zunongwangia sp. F297]MDT0649629.1 polysaccharide deacetylase family protein [Zunongwangia sp. F297]